MKNLLDARPVEEWLASDGLFRIVVLVVLNNGSHVADQVDWLLETDANTLKGTH